MPVRRDNSVVALFRDVGFFAMLKRVLRRARVLASTSVNNVMGTFEA